VAVYNLGLFFALPIGFYVNGLMLKKIRITWLHLDGLIISVMSVLAVIFFSTSSSWHLFIYGCIFGLGSGLYWANRNFLTFQETQSSHRNYFFSIITVVESLISLVVTFLAGWLIVFGEYSHLYAPTIAYWIFGFLALVVSLVAGLIILNKDYQSPPITQIAKCRISRRWNKVRAIMFNIGLLEGIMFFLPTLLILLYLGKEGILGTITTIVTLFTAAITYIYGRKSKGSHRRPIFFISLIIYIFLSILLVSLDQPLNIIIFVLFAGVIKVFQWLTLNPELLDLMDNEINNEYDNRYTLIFDREVFLNIGRILSVLVLFFIIYATSPQIGLLFTPLILGVSKLILMFLVWKKNII